MVYVVMVHWMATMEGHGRPVAGRPVAGRPVAGRPVADSRGV